jgi:hypothetical protein
MVNRIKHRFRECQRFNDTERIKKKIVQGRKVQYDFIYILDSTVRQLAISLTCLDIQYLHGIVRANANDRKCVMRILRATYGRTGKVRHYLLMVSGFCLNSIAL